MPACVSAIRGSGVITGSVDSSAVLLNERSSEYTITFNGSAADEKIVGSYVVHWAKLPSEYGAMAVMKINKAILPALNVNACPSDAESSAWAG
jgi:hypothetical protein